MHFRLGKTGAEMHKMLITALRSDAVTKKTFLVVSGFPMQYELFFMNLFPKVK
jgi:hypothetical protein